MKEQCAAMRPRAAVTAASKWPEIIISLFYTFNASLS